MAGLGLALSKIGFSLIASLVTEAFVKRLLVHALEILVKKTSSETDDKILADVKKAWQVD